MGRKKLQPTRMMRVRIQDYERLKQLARMYQMSIPEFIARFSRRMIK